MNAANYQIEKLYIKCVVIEPKYFSVFGGLVSSIELTTDYSFNSNSVRPFVGLGAGPFWVPTNTPTSSGPGNNLYSATTFGVTERAGVEVGHFRTAVEVNLVVKV